MKKMLLSIVCALMVYMVGSPAVAVDQCEVVGNSYTVTINDDEWTLTDFVKTGPHFSPAPQCAGTVSLVSPNGEYSYFKWCATGDGLKIAGCPAVLINNELKLKLKLYCVPTGLHSLQIGDVVYMTEQEVPLLLFK